ncbi:hypothetical protein [Piscirickettsia litoralis]|uniref:Uncharacterized protein n=1 Tax=Piscirickettsia litoralis TaxID=1891921 RepID=A0ABX2ZXU2_9GAMM|nr:hypothetical protein [Piscirickettsia litoralis]ODN41427.1 hypothetical protein BGC07_16830 [Piscirickettsia litoralis]
MAAGDASKTWFDEVITELKKKWKSSMDWEQLIALGKQLTALRDKIREDRKILGPRMKCHSCGGHHHMNPTAVTVRAIIFALHTHKLISADKLAELEKSWKSYQRKHKLTGAGDPKPVKTA